MPTVYVLVALGLAAVAGLTWGMLRSLVRSDPRDPWSPHRKGF